MARTTAKRKKPQPLPATSGSGKDEADNQWSDMPVEWIGQVLVFLPIASLFSCMRVGKFWEHAARHEIKNRTHLKVAQMVRCYECREEEDMCMVCRRRRFSPDGTCIRIEDTDDIDAFAFLMQMDRLKVLEVDNVPEQIIGPLIQQNRKSLRVVRGVSTLSAFTTIPFPRLSDLICRRVDEASLALTPNLKYLTIDRNITEGEPGSSGEWLPVVPMPALKSLKVRIGINGGSEGLHVLAPVVTHLETDGRLDQETQSAVFHRLVNLKVSVRHRDRLPECPVLQSLTVDFSAPPSILSDLPVSLTILSVRTTFVSYDRFRDERKEGQQFMDLMTVVPRFVHLKELRIQTEKLKLTAKQKKELVPSFSCFRQLEVFALKFGPGSAEDMDKVVAQVTQSSPGLKEVTLTHIHLTDSAIKSLSRLSNLKSLTLELAPGLTQGVTTKGLTHLITSCSQSLHHLSVKNSSLTDVYKIENAFKSMLKNRMLEMEERLSQRKDDHFQFCSKSFTPSF